ncbi:MAG: hypothetical protein JXA87_11645 [Thermoleophilia bacterium]|nr:hypothetical protein [Thermoleophilia bacterium]
MSILGEEYGVFDLYPEIVEAILRDARASGEGRVSLVDVIRRYDARNKLAILLE